MITIPPPEDALDLDIVEIVLRLLKLGLRVLRHFHDLVEVGHYASPLVEKDFELGAGKGVDHRLDIGVREHFGANPLLRDFFLVEQ